MRAMSDRWVSTQSMKGCPMSSVGWHLLSVLLTFMIALHSEEMSLCCLFYEILRLLVICNYTRYLL